MGAPSGSTQAAPRGNQLVRNLLDTVEDNDEDDEDFVSNKKRVKRTASGATKRSADDTRQWIVEGEDPVDLLGAGAAAAVVSVDPSKRRKVESLEEAGLSYMDDGRLKIHEEPTDS